MSESDVKEDVKFSLKVTVNKHRTRVLFAKVDCSFADVLLSFLTLPLGTIARILQKHYGDEAPSVGSLTTLYKSLSNLDSANFWTEDAKSILLHPRSSFDARRKGLKLDINDSLALEYFVCGYCYCDFENESMYYDNLQSRCSNCWKYQMKKQEKKNAETCDGRFTRSTASFVITDDLHIMPDKGLMQIVGFLGTTCMDNSELFNVTLGFSEVVDLLKASLISSTPLSDVILKKTGGEMNSPIQKYENASTSDNSNKVNLKLIVQKSTNKLVYAEAEEDFVEFLYGLLIFPLGVVESLLKSNCGIKAIDNLYKSVGDFMNEKYFKNGDEKEMVMKPKIPHGYIPKSNILPFNEVCLPNGYAQRFYESSHKFPEGQGKYLVPQTYKIADDLTVTPFCVASIISSLNKMNISMSDVKEVQLKIGLEEGLRILKASLTSISALTDAHLLDLVANKQPKPEP